MFFSPVRPVRKTDDHFQTNSVYNAEQMQRTLDIRDEGPLILSSSSSSVSMSRSSQVPVEGILREVGLPGAFGS